MGRVGLYGILSGGQVCPPRCPFQAEREKWEQEYERQQEEIKELRKRIKDTVRQTAYRGRPPRDNDKMAYDFFFQYPQTGRERTLLLPPPQGKYIYQTLKSQVKMHYGQVEYEDEFVAKLIGYGLFRLEDMSKTVGQLSVGQRRHPR